MVKVPFTLEKSQKKTSIKLPDYYTDIKPTNDGKPEPPQVESVASSSSNISYDDFEWLNNLNSLSNADSNERYSFSAFHSQQMKDQQINFKTQSTLLPILLESVNSLAVVRHCMKIIKQLTQHLNQSQKQIIITGNQSVYALGKKVQWMFPNQFRDVLWMMDPLHIEMAFSDGIGNWFDGSGWTNSFERAKITTAGQIELLVWE